MANYDDYQLEEMENAAVDRSRNLRRGALAGAAIIGAGGTAAFGATKIAEAHADGEMASDLTQEDLFAGADAAVEDLESQADTPPAAPVENHVHIHVHEEEPIRQPEEIDINVEETALLYDEDGNLVGTYDAGKIDGKDFVVLDNDLNGKGDVLAYDINGNGVFEEQEVFQIDNDTYEMGQGKEFNLYARNDQGDFEKVNIDPVYEARHDSLADIHNDFEDEKTGEYYRGDLAENNRDYINNDAEQYSAGMERTEGDLYAEVDDKYGEESGFGYESSEDLAYDDTSAQFDDPSVYDA